jgi:hypothetical protein
MTYTGSLLQLGTFAGGQTLNITTGGNVGIGTTSPSGKLHVAGDGDAANLIRLQHTGSGTNGFFDFSVTSTQASLIANYSSTAIPMLFLTGATERMRITSGGLVLIGTSTLGAATGVTDLLTIGKSGSSSTGVNFTDGTSTRWGFIYANNAKMVYGSFTDVAFESGASATERMRITSGGNVGIGTTSPQSYTNYRILHLAAPTTTGGGLLYLTNSDNSIRGLAMAEGGLSAIIFGSQSNHSVQFWSNDTERMRITSGGNVGIGTESPTTKLDVVGDMKTGEPDTGYGRAAFKIGSRQTGTATDSGGYIPISIDGTVYFINLFTSTP